MGFSGNRAISKDVFSAELEELKLRRERLGLLSDDLKNGGLAPSVDKKIIGLALSGGGIRSATLGLGVVQALSAKGLFKSIDYLSTVSGGGFLGSFISSMLNNSHTVFDGDHCPLATNAEGVEPKAINHLRNSGNYLAPGGFLEKLRIPALLLRGMLINLALLLPYIVLAVLLTEIWYEYSSQGFDEIVRGLYIIIGGFLCLGLLSPYVLNLFGNRFNWNARNRYDLLYTFFMATTIAIAAAIPFLVMIDYAVDHSWQQLLTTFDADESKLISDESFLFWVAGTGQFALIVVLGVIARFIGRVRGKVALVVAMIVGPMFIFTLYASLCLMQIDAPTIPVSSIKAHVELDSDDLDPVNSPNIAEKITTLFSEVKAGDVEIVKVEVVTPKSKWEVTSSLGVLLVLRDEENLIVRPKNIDTALNSGSVDYFLAEALRKKGVDVVLGGAISKVNSGWMIDAIDGRKYFISNKDHSLYLSPSPVDVWDDNDEILYGGAIILLLINVLLVNINKISLHCFYRDRISRAYVLGRREDGDVFPNDRQKLSGLRVAKSSAPYHLLNVTLNLQGSDSKNLRGRAADFFFFSKLFSGGEYTGYVKTKDLETLDSHLDLATAAAVSGAAASPNAGTATVKPLVFILTMLNIRLGYWLVNPSKIAAGGFIRRFLMRLGAGPSELFREALSKLNTKGRFVNISDGGHIENLAIYELLRRRCKFIFAVDGEADPNMTFAGLATLIRFAKIDLGIDININLSRLAKNSEGHSAAHCALGKICYPDGEVGYLCYLKSSVSGDENPYVQGYKTHHPSFPHESTTDQFFNEEQFEVYRSLGEHITNGLFIDVGLRDELHAALRESGLKC